MRYEGDCGPLRHIFAIFTLFQFYFAVTSLLRNVVYVKKQLFFSQVAPNNASCFGAVYGTWFSTFKY